MKRKPSVTLGMRLVQVVLGLVGTVTSVFAFLGFTALPFPWFGAVFFLIPPLLCFGTVAAIQQGIGLGERAGGDTPWADPQQSLPPDPAVWPPPPNQG